MKRRTFLTGIIAAATAPVLPGPAAAAQPAPIVAASEYVASTVVIDPASVWRKVGTFKTVFLEAAPEAPEAA